MALYPHLHVGPYVQIQEPTIYQKVDHCPESTKCPYPTMGRWCDSCGLLLTTRFVNEPVTVEDQITQLLEADADKFHLFPAPQEQTFLIPHSKDVCKTWDLDGLHFAEIFTEPPPKSERLHQVSRFEELYEPELIRLKKHFPHMWVRWGVLVYGR